MDLSPGQRLALKVIALFGLIGPNGVFLYYLFFRWRDLVTGMTHPVALAFVVEAFVVLGLMAIHFARRPLGRHGWKTFVALSLLGGLGFGVPAYVLLNSPETRR